MVVQTLNETVWATLAPSELHGVGVFALRDIPKGTKLNARGSLNPEPLRLDSFDGLNEDVRRVILQRWPHALQGDFFHSPNDDARLLSFMNHSATPNYDPLTDTTLTDIERGQEVTEDYGSLPFY